MSAEYQKSDQHGQRCVLCHSEELEAFFESYHHCKNCDLRFLDPSKRLSEEAEKKRYLIHNDGVADEGYLQFIEPLVNVVKETVTKGSHGLDFGAGRGAVLAKVLEDDGYVVALYDPFFWPDQKVLNEKYDFITSCEVVEHFYDPRAEFERLKSLLNKDGALALMTLLCDESTNFKDWHYRRDTTHVVFYSRKTFEFIAKEFGFSPPEFTGDRVIMLKSR